MAHRGGSSRNKYLRGSALSDPICKRLVSSQLNPTDQIRLINEVLVDKGEQQAAKDLEPGDALKLVELLDLTLRTGDLDVSIRPAFIHHLAEVCGWHAIIPNSAQISGHELESPYSGDTHSKVWIGKYNGQKVTIKAPNIYGSYDQAQKRKIAKAFCKEVVIWKNLSHQNVLQFIGAAIVTEPGQEKCEVVSKFMENGNINTFILKNEGVNRLELLKDVAAGLKYLHSQLVIHGDLKGPNILISKHQRACLANFGLTRITTEFTSSDPENKTDALWMSPERFSSEKFSYKNGKSTKESDVYSLGVVIYEVICGHRPFPNLAERWAAQELWKGELPPRPEVGFTDSLWKTLGDCLKPEREERPNAETVLRRLDEALRV